MQTALGTAIIKLVNYVFIWLAFSLLIGTLLYTVFSFDDANQLELNNILMESLAIFIPVLIATLAASRLFDQRRWRSFGLAFYPKAGFEIFVGLLMGAGILFLLWGIDAVWHFLAGGEGLVFPEIKASGTQMLSLLLLMLVVAFSEELLVRGYPLQVIIRYVGVVPAVVFTSIIFGALHITGDVWNAAVVVLDTGFSGVIFALAYLKTRALWMPIAIHFSNNFMISIFDEVNLNEINVIPPDVSQDAFWGWWLVNFPLYVILILLIIRWRYRPDAKMERLFQQHVATLKAGSKPYDASDFSEPTASTTESGENSQ